MKDLFGSEFDFFYAKLTCFVPNAWRPNDPPSGKCNGRRPEMAQRSLAFSTSKILKVHSLICKTEQSIEDLAINKTKTTTFPGLQFFKALKPSQADSNDLKRLPLRRILHYCHQVNISLDGLGFLEAYTNLI